MNNLSARDIYAIIVDGKEVRISCPDRRTFNILRVALAKQQSMMVAIGGSTKSLISRFDEEKQVAMYKLDQRAPGIRFTLLDVDGLAPTPPQLSVSSSIRNFNDYLNTSTGDSINGSQVRTSVDSLIGERGSNSAMPESWSESCMSSDIQREIPPSGYQAAEATAGIRASADRETRDSRTAENDSVDY